MRDCFLYTQCAINTSTRVFMTGPLLYGCLEISGHSHGEFRHLHAGNPFTCDYPGQPT